MKSQKYEAISHVWDAEKARPFLLQAFRNRSLLHNTPSVIQVEMNFCPRQVNFLIFMNFVGAM